MTEAEAENAYYEAVQILRQTRGPAAIDAARAACDAALNVRHALRNAARAQFREAHPMPTRVAPKFRKG